MLSKQRLKELAEILREDYGRDLPPQEVFKIGTQLVNFFELLIRLESKGKSKENKTDIPDSTDIDKNETKMAR